MNVGGWELGRSDQLPFFRLAFPGKGLRLLVFSQACRSYVLHAQVALVVGSILIERESLVVVPVAKMLAHIVCCWGHRTQRGQGIPSLLRRP
jgi:hypothetical protein